MNGSSLSPPDSINIWCTWALTVTYEAGEYTEQKFKAEKTGGGPVIPSPNLDTDLVMFRCRWILQDIAVVEQMGHESHSYTLGKQTLQSTLNAEAQQKTQVKITAREDTMGLIEDAHGIPTTPLIIMVH
ncbi:hypothetical protein BDR06DRAFT_966760 [Suillus hirtellus]|nr:hypothetical protein BDR06DRAFT_966760 [Suillus hirtellus]